MKMVNSVFELVSTYEFFVQKDKTIRPIRFEVFRREKIYRARVWIQSTYNLYPTFVNIDSSGNDTQSIHSSDEMNNEITSLIAEEPSFITGQEYKTEGQFIEYVISLIKKNYKLVESKCSE